MTPSVRNDGNRYIGVYACGYLSNRGRERWKYQVLENVKWIWKKTIGFERSVKIVDF
jgi:hypothetical protein